MGRKDLSRFDWLRNDEESEYIGAQVDIRKELPEDLMNEVELGTRKPDDLCWVMSHDCWVCGLWNYYMPMISKFEIAEIDDGENPRLSKLTEK